MPPPLFFAGGDKIRFVPGNDKEHPIGCSLVIMYSAGGSRLAVKTQLNAFSRNCALCIVHWISLELVVYPLDDVRNACRCAS